MAIGVMALTGLNQPRALKAQEEASIDKDLLVTRAESFLTRTAKIRPGESVLIITDRSVDDMVRAAFFEAASQAEVTISELVLQGHPDMTDGLEIARRMRFEIWYPDWIWSTASEVDVVLAMTSLTSGHAGRDPELPAATRMVSVPFARREQLADPMARGNYPEEILAAIAKTVWKQVWGAQEIELKDAEGTDLTWTVDAHAWDEIKGVDPARNAEHLSLPPPYRARRPDMEGWLVGSSTHSGPLPRVRLKIQGGRVVDIQDGQHVAEYLRQMFAASRTISFPGFPDAGSNWVEETALGTHPRHTRVAGAEELGWWAEMRGWNGAPRAGVVHLAVGTSRSGRNAQFARRHGLEVQHLDIELYTPTLVMDGRTIISRGRLLALDDPHVRRVASKYGDPDELLRVTWVPGRERRSF